MESGVEAVALETPPYFFPDHATAAVEAGLHVYMAKPVAVDVPGCLAIEAAVARRAGEKKRVFFVDYQVPTDPHNQEVVRRIGAGRSERRSRSTAITSPACSPIRPSPRPSKAACRA